ncbi:MAG: DUF2254 domain-containing protein [Clostridiales bacterium]|nr:DUF2254 domain-containing protein [Clostridiales bacterium]
MIKKILNKIKTSIWLYPTIYSLFALALSFIITMIDQVYVDEMSSDLFDFFYTTTPLAQAVLGIIASAFITIATFTFSTTMIVLTMYSSQFTPRVVENFLNNETTMKSFGVFLSGFIYAITSLLFLNINENGNLVIAASVGVIYVIVGLIYFLVFIHNVSTHIQANGLILRLENEALEKINQYRDLVKESNIVTERTFNKIIDNKNYTNLNSRNDGYIQEIDYNRLLRIAQSHNLIICFKKVVGQFVSTETRIMTIYYEGEHEIGKEIQHEIHQCIWIGNKKTETQDFSFTIQKIVEIALRALSPGINDPNTAIHCLKNLGLLLRDLADIDKGYVVLREEDEGGFIMYEAYDFEILLYDAYQQIILYGQSDASVMIVVFKSLRFSKANASSDNIKTINAYATNLYEKLNNNRFDPLEYEKIRKEYSQLIGQ